MSLITVEEAKSFLKITAVDDDALIEQIVNAVDKRIKTYLNNNLEQDTYTDELVNGFGRNFIIPKHFPITEVTSIHVYEGLDSNYDEDWDLWEQGDDYDRLLIGSNGDVIRLIGGHFPTGQQNVKITYTAGYETIPEDITFTCLQLVQLYYMGVRGESILGKSSVSRPMGQGVTTTYDLTVEERLLNNIVQYKLYNV